MLAQNSPFGPLPPAAPAPTPTPDDNTTNVLGQDVGRSTLFLIAGGFVIALHRHRLVDLARRPERAARAGTARMRRPCA